MKLLFTQDALVNAGAERSHLEILSRFSEEVDVTLVYFYPKHDLKSAYEKAGIRLIFLDIPESYHFGLAISRLLKLIKSEKPDLLVSSLWRADQITRFASFLTGVPLVGTLVNDSYAPPAWKDKKGLKYKGVYWLDRLTARIPIHWIANAQELADSHVGTLGLDAKKISVVYRGRRVSEVWWARIENGRIEKEGLGRGRDERGEQGLRKRNLGEEIKRIKPYKFLSYGRLLERKGFQDAIRAFAVVNKKYPDCGLTIYGEGPYRGHLEALIAKLDLKGKVLLPGKFGMGGNENWRMEYERIENEGRENGRMENESPDSHREENEIAAPSLRSARNDATAILLENDCFLFPSWYEGFSGALVEAMMAGIPIIASDIPMNLEALTHKQSALIFPVGNSEELSRQMIRMIENPELASRLGKEAHTKAMARFDIDIIARQYEEVIWSVFQKYGNSRTKQSL